MKNTFNFLAAGLMALSWAISVGPAWAQIVYVDATHGESGNTAVAPSAGGGEFTPIDPQGPPGDGLWDVRAFSNNATIYQNAGTDGSPDDAHRLVTSVNVPSNSYNVFAYFWSDTSNTWRMAASLMDEAGDLPLYEPTTSGVTAADAGSFASSVLTTEGNRTMYQIPLGQVTGDSISVYVDDDSNQAGQEQRTWYDGIGYSVVPEPTSLVLSVISFVGIAGLRRRLH